jgi:hypothetical protein
MRTFGAVLIVAGVVMFLFNGFNYITEKRVVDIGPIKIDKAEKHYFSWPAYAGGIALVAGIVILVGAKRKVS